MALQVSQSGGSDFELIPEGQYTARCFKVIDLGTQTIMWSGEEKLQPKVMISWEILDDPKMTDGKPFAVTKTYTASLNENSHLYKDLVAWRGKAFTPEELLGFDISKLLGAYCQIQVIHNEKDGRTYANINAIMGTKDRPAPVNKDTMFDISNPDMTLFESFSDWLKTKIQSSEEWKAKEVIARGEAVEKTKEVFSDLKDEVTTDDADGIDLRDIPF